MLRIGLTYDKYIIRMSSIGLADMNLTQLRAFHAVARERSFTKAARAARVSQPTLSGQVSALEAQHRVRLLERRGRGAEPTAIGQALYELANRLFALEDEAEALLEGRDSAAPRAHIRVAADGPAHAIPILAEMKKRRPGLTFYLGTGNSAEVLKQLFDYDADVGVMAKMVSDPRLHTLAYRRDRLVVFAPAKHPLARVAKLKLADLAGTDLVLRERGSITREVFETALAEAGIRPRAIVEAESREAVREAVGAGFGLGVVFESELLPDRRFAILEVSDAPLGVGEYVVCLAERRRLPLVREFLDTAAALGGVPAVTLTTKGRSNGR